eukprot:3406661-Amphidinium_carterae.1
MAQVWQKLLSHVEFVVARSIALSLRQHSVHAPRTYIMSESPELSGKRKWISEERADPPPGARPKAKARIQDERTIEWHVVEMSDTPALWSARMKEAFMKNETGDFDCK